MNPLHRVPARRLVHALPAIARRSTRTGVIVFGAWSAYLGLWLLATWPGLSMTDSADVVMKVQRGVVHEWFSYVRRS